MQSLAHFKGASADRGHWKERGAMYLQRSGWLGHERCLLQRRGWIGKWAPEPPCVVTMIHTLVWLVAAGWMECTVTGSGTPGRYWIPLCKQVSCDDLLRDVQIRFGWKLNSAFSPRHCYLTCRLLGFQGVSPAVQDRAKPGTAGAFIISAMVVEGLAAWHDMQFTFHWYGREPWGLRTAQHEWFQTRATSCVFGSPYSFKYSVTQPLKNINLRVYVPRLSLICRSRKDLCPSNYCVLWKCSCSALYSVWELTWSALQALNQRPVNLSVPWQAFGLPIVFVNRHKRIPWLAHLLLP